MRAIDFTRVTLLRFVPDALSVLAPTLTLTPNPSPNPNPNPNPNRNRNPNPNPNPNQHLGTEHLEALQEASALLETEEVCTLIEQAAESPRSPAAALTGGPGSPAPSSSAVATGAPPASALAASAPAAAEAAASSEPDVLCHCGLKCVVCTAGYGYA